MNERLFDLIERARLAAVRIRFGQSKPYCKYLVKKLAGVKRHRLEF